MPCNWSIIYQASHKNAMEGCHLKMILRMKKKFMLSVLVPISTRVGEIVRKWMTVHTCNIWMVCFWTSWMNTKNEMDEDWFNVVLVGFFYYLCIWRSHGSQLRYCQFHPVDQWNRVGQNTKWHVWQAVMEIEFRSERCLQLCYVDGMYTEEVKINWDGAVHSSYFEVNG